MMISTNKILSMVVWIPGSGNRSSRVPNGDIQLPGRSRGPWLHFRKRHPMGIPSAALVDLGGVHLRRKIVLLCYFVLMSTQNSVYLLKYLKHPFLFFLLLFIVVIIVCLFVLMSTYVLSFFIRHRNWFVVGGDFVVVVVALNSS